MNRLKPRLQLVMATVFLMLGLTFLSNVPVMALDCSDDGNTSAKQIQSGVDCANGNSGSTDTTRPINNTISTVINILSVGIGIVAVIMLMVGGYRYITSAGVSEKVATAKKTILYAIIGLAIVALSQAIAKYVINKANDTTTPPKTGMIQETTRLTQT